MICVHIPVCDEGHRVLNTGTDKWAVSSLHRITQLLSRIKYGNRGIFCCTTFSVASLECEAVAELINSHVFKLIFPYFFGMIITGCSSSTVPITNTKGDEWWVKLIN